MFHSPHRHLTFEHNRTIQIESGFWDDNLASQPFTDFEGLSGKAVESFAAEIFGRTFDGFVSHRLEQIYRPMHCHPSTLTAVIKEGHGGCGRIRHPLIRQLGRISATLLGIIPTRWHRKLPSEIGANQATPRGPPLKMPTVDCSFRTF